ncbi:M56 family metallopeptidase [Roseateles saccharophilus]|uniref:Beta-lactamase regulating signal transducer with metallopeptidase domain n=1 Tax=Roseateles saccharophilus TaxID=304 RepID=A0A4R3V1Q9_ROSSA|nr:M56 family metallopeptidase [Roseateles saccharophilus]MDG0831411.1 M56 family metallopeptidase [Roseateles saccharophilus]TCU98706.1 beta-lactamase regulating signal transducer with metallopeptidase domain [Roseateles saccharophilus]
MSEAVFGALLHQAMLLSVGIALLWAIHRSTQRRLGAGATYAAWLLLPALLLAPALPRPAQEPLRVVLQAAGRLAMPALPTLPAPATSTSGLWLALWLAGTGFFVGLQTQRQWRLDRLGVRLPAGSSPALVGLLRPHVALPADFEQRFSPAERELILAHEQVHRARLDNLWNLLACALTALHWWNPLAWWAARRMRADQELACDAAVLAARPQARTDYTRALLAAHDLTPHAAPLASCWGTAHPLVERIAMLNRPLPLNRRRALAVATAVSLTTALAYAAESPPAVDGGYVQLHVQLENNLGSTRSRVATDVAIPIGKLTKLELPDAKSEPIWISLLTSKTPRDDVKFHAEITRGEPAVQWGSTILNPAWGTITRIEMSRSGSEEKVVLELTPTRVPADFQPPKNTF